MYIVALTLLLRLVTSTWAYPHPVVECNKGPSYWCKDYDTATQCGVLNYCKASNPDFGKNTAAQPVLIELYYESYCGGCRNFIREQLFPAFQELYETGIFDIKLYPYGNAHESQVGQKWKFDCQHGERECQTNLIETCALHLMSHPQQFMPYIHCVEGTPTIANARKCADDLQVEWGPISACYNGSQGNQLEHEMAIKTDALNPKHTYVPWIVVNGQHTERMQTDAQLGLIEFICKTYTGVQPHACRVHQNNGRKCYKN